MDFDWSLATFFLTLGGLFATFLFRKRILRAFGRLLFTESVKFVRATYFDEVEEDTPDGPKRVLLRPNALAEGILASVVPGLLQMTLKNVKIRVPDILKSIPNVGAEELGQALMGSVAQKAMSGKKLKVEDMVQGAFGFFMPKIQEFVGSMGGKKPSETTEKLPPHLVHPENK